MKMSHSSLIKVEPYWNVKYPVQLHRIIYPLIKVEPYWNVKFRICTGGRSSDTIKVEPYWNVKRIAL